MKNRALWMGAFAVWVTATGAAFAALDRYSSRPGVAAVAPVTWPQTSRLTRTPGRAAVVMIAHTRCACTRASLRELERLMTRAGDRAEAFVVFVGPHERTFPFDVRDTARAIAHTSVVEDEVEARLFGAATSGQVLVYDRGGALAFRGGITPSRGHEGSSAGGETVHRLVGPPSDTSITPRDPIASDVFGCGLFDPRNP